MKKSLKILSLALSATLAIGMTTGLAFTASALGGNEAVPAPVAETKAQAQVYLVPGEGNSLEGTPLSAEETAALHMEGSVYKAGAAGTQLPTPTTTKTDKNNTPFTFNGWWTVVDATVTYFETVPEVPFHLLRGIDELRTCGNGMLARVDLLVDACGVHIDAEGVLGIGDVVA